MSSLSANAESESGSRTAVLVLGLGSYAYGREKRIVRYFQNSRCFRPVFVLSVWTDGSVEGLLQQHGFPYYNRLLGYFGRATPWWTLYTLLRAPLTVASLLALYRKHHCRGVLIADIGTFALTLPALVLLRLLWRSKTVFYIGDTPDLTRANRLLGRAAAWLALPVIANSHAVQQRFRELGIPESRIRVIHNGLALEDFDHAAAMDFRKRNNWPEGGFIFGFVGQIIAGKGVEDFVVAAERLLEQGLDVRFVLVGRCETEPPLVARLRARMNQWPDRFELCGEIRPIEGVYKGLDAIVVPSRRREPLPNVAIEAMACAKPVVATRVGGIGEVVLHGLTGVLVPPGDPDGLANAMRQLAENQDMAAKMGAAGRQRVRECFRIERTAENVDVALTQGFAPGRRRAEAAAR